MLTHDDGRQPIAIGHLSYSGVMSLYRYTGGKDETSVDIQYKQQTLQLLVITSHKRYLQYYGGEGQLLIIYWVGVLSYNISKQT